ncbi:uncharacterized protein LOC133511259 isoform X2 [Syngnathoides biaculeatus]|uniref:uncharacterized protein LOC133511259 isoform X2 n=1 Tax=Syngnathoides biaculeatus TaxID=300417 RepID=UPI002ADD8BBC|nr:uncharacterized protein LOC133511259 isoform X2 [Syngnathoides biaculeatus]XP_061696016.1 uncharacterized protein LOC133511259 isoform X2 [Syngnathoides biaculeatus]
MCGRPITEYADDFCENKENERQLFDAVSKQPRVVLYTADGSEKSLCPEQQESESVQIKEEEEEHVHIKEKEEPHTPYDKEEEHNNISKLPMYLVSLKSEEENDKVKSEESRQAEAPSSSSSQHTTTGGD